MKYLKTFGMTRLRWLGLVTVSGSLLWLLALIGPAWWPNLIWPYPEPSRLPAYHLQNFLFFLGALGFAAGALGLQVHLGRGGELLRRVGLAFNLGGALAFVMYSLLRSVMLAAGGLASAFTLTGSLAFLVGMLCWGIWLVQAKCPLRWQVAVWVQVLCLAAGVVGAFYSLLLWGVAWVGLGILLLISPEEIAVLSAP